MLRGIKFKRSLTAALISISNFFLIAPAQALVPYVYLPTEVELSGSSLGIGRTAAQLLQMGQPKEAAQLAALAVRLNPNDERLWTVLAEAQLRSNQLEDASQSLAKAKKINPNNAGLWFAEAAIALRAQRPEEAIPLIQRGLQIDANNAGSSRSATPKGRTDRSSIAGKRSPVQKSQLRFADASKRAAMGFPCEAGHSKLVA